MGYCVTLLFTISSLTSALLKKGRLNSQCVFRGKYKVEWIKTAAVDTKISILVSWIYEKISSCRHIRDSKNHHHGNKDDVQRDSSRIFFLVWNRCNVTHSYHSQKHRWQKANVMLCTKGEEDKSYFKTSTVLISFVKYLLENLEKKVLE